MVNAGDDNDLMSAAANKLSIANNVISKRKEQLKQWEESEMNKLAPIRRPVDRSKVKFQDSDVFLSACVSGDEDEVDDLLEKGANINTTTIDGVTALHQAVIDGKIETIKFLLDRGADIDAQDNEGWTPLHAAVCCGSLPIVQLLCDRGADLTCVNSDKELAVDLAEDDNIKEYLEKQFLNKNIDAEECRDLEYNTMMKDCTEWIRCGRYLDKPHPRTGATALHVAASKGYNQLIGMLIRAGANVHAKDVEGWTALHAAAHWGEKDACRILMENGAKLSDKNYADQDVLRVADKSIVEFLENLQKSLEKPVVKPISVQISQSASNVLQPTNVTSMHLKRSSVPRLSTDEKISLTKKDEQDENMSLTMGVDVPTVRSPVTPPPLSPSPVALTSLNKYGSPERSVSPPPVKRPTMNDTTEPTKTIVLRNYPEKSDSGSSVSSTPSVVAVLPAPRITSSESSSSQSAYSSTSATSSSSSVAEFSTKASPTLTAAVLATQKPPPFSISKQTIQIPTTSNEQKTAPLGEGESDLEDEEMETETPKSRDNTASGVSSITTMSRSVSTQNSSSNLYSSDQNVECTIKVPTTKFERSTPSSISANTFTTRPNLTTSFTMDVPKKVYPTMGTVNIGLSKTPSQSASEASSPMTSPTVHARNIVPNVVQRSASSNNAPWVAHVKSGISNVGKNVEQFNNQHTPTCSSTRPPLGPRPIQETLSYQRYIRSSQTPPTQPISQKESEAERKAKSRQQRAARRSTQGVSSDMVRAATEEMSNWRSSTLQQTAIQNSAAASSKRSDEDLLEPLPSVQHPTSAINTPSANKFRRSQVVRANRRGTGPVDFDALSAANETGEAENDEADQKYANITVRRRDDVNKTPTLPKKTYQESQNSASVLHGPTNHSRVISGVATSSVNGNGPNVTTDRYKQLYEKERDENERLRRKLEQMNVKSGELANGTAKPNVSMEDYDRKALERRIAHLEYELEKAKQLQSDYKKLKDENGALIRVISKLSTK